MSELVFFTKHNTTRENMLNLLKEYSILCDKMFGVMRELLKIYEIFLDLNGMQIQEGHILKTAMLQGAYDFISIIKMSCVYENTDLSTSIIREVTFLNIALTTPGFRYTTYKIPLSLEDIMEKFNSKKKKLVKSKRGNKPTLLLK